MGNSFGHLFRITTWGESHGTGIGVVIDGCPPGLELSEEDIQRDLDRRRPGQSDVVTQRNETDRCQILSGVFEGRTLGTPIAIVVQNEDMKPAAYSDMKTAFRPSHADFTYQAKYGHRSWEGGGRASARETIGRVAAGAVAKKVLHKLFEGRVELVAYVLQIYDITARVDRDSVRVEVVESNPVRCPDKTAAKRMMNLIQSVRVEGDSVGGVIECVVRGVEAGLGGRGFNTKKVLDAQLIELAPQHRRGLDLFVIQLRNTMQTVPQIDHRGQNLIQVHRHDRCKLTVKACIGKRMTALPK